jgi:F-type H+-transporting ATPase subunit a
MKEKRGNMFQNNLILTEEFSGISVKTQFLNISISAKIIYAIITLIILTIVLSKMGKKISNQNPNEAPKGIAVAIPLWLYNSLRNLIKSILGDKVDEYLPVLGTLFVYILILNWSGLLGLGEFIGTTSISLTMAYAFGIAVFAIVVAIKKKGGQKYISGYLKPFPLFLPLNIIEVFAKPFSMGIRIFANLTSGVIIATILKAMIANLLSGIGPISVAGAQLAITPLLNGYFDLFAGFIQALIFTILATVSILESVE